MIKLGEPGTLLADATERPRLMIETGFRTGQFESAPWLSAFTVQVGSNDRVPTAKIELALGENYSVASGAEAAILHDWEMRGLGDAIAKPQSLVLEGRRIRITSGAWSLADRWAIFEGFIDSCEIGWSGSSNEGGRRATMFCTSTIVAADREPGQQLWGQWRRTYAAVRDGTNVCCRVPVPLVFNPNGQPNCDPSPLVFADGSKVYIPCDAGRSDAVWFTVAKMLRYIEWAAKQPAPPMVYSGENGAERYDIPYTSNTLGVYDLAWTSFGLKHQNLDALLRVPLSETATILDVNPDAASGDPLSSTLLRAYRNMAGEGMSVLEAFTHHASRCGMLCFPHQEWNNSGQIQTSLAFAIRGYRIDDGIEPRALYEPPPAIENNDDDSGDTAAATGDDGGVLGKGISGAFTRGVYVHVVGDQFTPDPAEPVDLLHAANAVEGAFTIRTDGQRNSVRVQGSPANYEMTVDLVPGWTPDAYWDVNPNDQAAVDDAIAFMQETEWANLFVRSSGDPAAELFAGVGRYWVLNEDGAFTPENYRRNYGPWATDSAWAPYDFAAVAGVEELMVRGADGWAPRARKFLEPMATIATNATDLPGAGRVGILLQVSFDGGGRWFSRCVSFKVAQDRGAISITDDDMRALVPGWDSNDPDFDQDLNFVSAYIKGLLRLRVSARIESDDVVFGCGRAAPAPVHDWLESLDRRGRFVRELRHAAANVLGDALPWPEDKDSTTDADSEARRLCQEIQSPRVSGSFTVPYLLRARDDVAWPNYRIGDELLGVKTGRAETDISFEEPLDGGGTRAPRIIGITHRWSEAPTEMTTTVQVEDETYTPDDMLGTKKADDE